MQNETNMFAYTVRAGKANNTAFIRPLPRKSFTEDQIEGIGQILKREDYVKSIKLTGGAIEVVFHRGKTDERVEIIKAAVPQAPARAPLMVPPRKPKLAPSVHVTKTHAENMLIAFFSIGIKEGDPTSFNQMIAYLTGEAKTFEGEFDSRWHRGLVCYTKTLDDYDTAEVSKKMKSEYLTIPEAMGGDKDYEARMKANRHKH